MAAIKPDDVFVFSLQLTNKKGTTYPLTHSVMARDMNLGVADATKDDPIPEFNRQEYLRLLKSDKVGDKKAADDLLTNFRLTMTRIAAETVAAGGDKVAKTVVDYIIRTSPGNEKFSREGGDTSYGISEEAINIIGPQEIDGDTPDTKIRVFKVVARATWGF